MSIPSAANSLSLLHQHTRHLLTVALAPYRVQLRVQAALLPPGHTHSGPRSVRLPTPCLCHFAQVGLAAGLVSKNPEVGMYRSKALYAGE